MTTNFKSNGVDIDTLLIKPEESILIAKEKRNLSSGYWEDGIGELWVCGANTNYELGTGDNSNKSNLTHIGSGIEWIDFDVASGQYALGINKDGILWTWGTSGNSVPVIMDSVNKWKKVFIANNGTTSITQFLIRNDNTLWAWGYNGYGQLGLGDTAPRTYTSKAQVGMLSDWKDVTGDFTRTLAIKTNGSLWAWGYNVYGQLGLGDTTNRSSPVQVGSLNDWAQVTSSSDQTFTIKKDGTLWAWGYNGSGQLGLGDTVSRSSPVQVGSLTNWKSVTIGTYGTYATKTDGTLWIIAGISREYTGGSGVISTSSPIQLGTLNIWDSVSASNHLIAITKDGGVKFSGYNVQGQCSQNTSGTSYQYVNTQQPPVSGYENNFIKAKAKGNSSFILAY